MEEFQKKRRDGSIRELTTCPTCRFYHRDWQRDPVVLTVRKSKRATVKGRRAQWKKHLWDKYRLTSADYDRMIVAQFGRCGVCWDPAQPVGLVVDHCHASERVRALLCGACNTALGLLREDPVRMRAAAEYVSLHKQ